MRESTDKPGEALILPSDLTYVSPFCRLASLRRLEGVGERIYGLEWEVLGAASAPLKGDSDDDLDATLM
jgi:hypothetical protein